MPTNTGNLGKTLGVIGLMKNVITKKMVNGRVLTNKCVMTKLEGSHVTNNTPLFRTVPTTRWGVATMMKDLTSKMMGGLVMMI